VGIPATKEPHGLSRSDGKRSDGLTLIPWQADKALTWDVTVVCPLADSYVHTAAQDAGSVADLAAAKPPETDSFEAFVRLKVGPKLAVNTPRCV